MSRAPVTTDLDVALPPRWESVALGRANVMSAIAPDDEAFTQYVGMVVTELLENAVRYGAWSEPAIAIRLRLRARGDTMTIIVTSPSSPQRTDVLLQTLASIRRHATARDAYEARVRELAEDGVPSGVSRLGLVRMMAEGPCELDAEIEDALLHVKATIRKRRDS